MKQIVSIKPTGFDTTGCWVRLIDPRKEIPILAKREGLEWQQLLGHDNQDQIGYTPYSSTTYVRQGLGIMLFNIFALDEGFAVFIRPFNRRIDWWYNGRDEIVTNHIKPIPGEQYNNGADDRDQRWNCHIEDIKNAMDDYRSEIAEEKYYQERPDEPIIFTWNEGFLRYQMSDITGFVVNEKSKVSVCSALAFRKAFNISGRLYAYDGVDGRCTHLNSIELCKQHGINTNDQTFRSVVDGYRASFQRCLSDIRQQCSSERKTPIVS